jgi:putative Mg2+ transporter-C (MgtC) family protein
MLPAPPEFNLPEQDIIKIALAVLCGVILGLERQYKNKTAGFRTVIVICLGSTIFTMVAQHSGQVANLNIVTGIGFIGAGVIFKDNIAVSGLTTAAVIWVSAAIGMSVGSGNYMLGLVSTLLTLTVLILFSMLEAFIDKIHRDKLFVIEFTNADYESLDRVKEIIASHQLTAQTVRVSKKDGCMQTAIWVTGHRTNISKLDEKLLQMPEVKSF